MKNEDPAEIALMIVVLSIADGAPLRMKV